MQLICNDINFCLDDVTVEQVPELDTFITLDKGKHSFISSEATL